MSKKDGNEKSQVRFSQLKQVSFNEEDLNWIQLLVKFLLEQIIEKIQKNGQKVNDGLLSLFSPEQLAFMMLNNVKA